MHGGGVHRNWIRGNVGKKERSLRGSSSACYEWSSSSSSSWQPVVWKQRQTSSPRTLLRKYPTMNLHVKNGEIIERWQSAEQRFLADCCMCRCDPPVHCGCPTVTGQKAIVLKAGKQWSDVSQDAFSTSAAHTKSCISDGMRISVMGRRLVCCVWWFVLFNLAQTFTFER